MDIYDTLLILAGTFIRPTYDYLAGKTQAKADRLAVVEARMDEQAKKSDTQVYELAELRADVKHLRIERNDLVLQLAGVTEHLDASLAAQAQSQDHIRELREDVEICKAEREDLQAQIVDLRAQIIAAGATPCRDASGRFVRKDSQ